MHADQLDGTVAYRGRHHKRAVAHDERVDAMGAAQSEAVVVLVHRVRGDERRDGIVDQNVARVGQRAGRAGGRQDQAGGGYGVQARDRAAGRQGALAGIVEVVRSLAGPHRVVEQQLCRSVARGVRCRAARVEPQHGLAIDEHGAVKGHCYDDCGARPECAGCGRRGDVGHARGGRNASLLLRVRAGQHPLRRRSQQLPAGIRRCGRRGRRQCQGERDGYGSRRSREAAASAGRPRTARYAAPAVRHPPPH